MDATVSNCMNSCSSKLPPFFSFLFNEVSKHLKISEIAIFALINKEANGFFSESILTRARELKFVGIDLKDAVNYLKDLKLNLSNFRKLKLLLLNEKKEKDPEALIYTIQNLKSEEILNLFSSPEIYAFPIESLLKFFSSDKIQEKKDGENESKRGSAIYSAVKLGSLKLIEFLLKKGVSPNDSHNNTFPIHVAVGKGNLDKVKLLIEYHADVNLIAYESTPLSFAVISGHVDIIEYLLQNGADPNMKVFEDKTVLTWAYIVENLPAVQLLKSYGAHL